MPLEKEGAAECRNAGAGDSCITGFSAPTPQSGRRSSEVSASITAVRAVRYWVVVGRLDSQTACRSLSRPGK
jgi:hypothetical protein